jgi:23S rRNA U2552 (ribose-2'-O)-methylase RlmE/FtsJ
MPWSDLGAWPGGWLQVAADLVGARGRVARHRRHRLIRCPTRASSCSRPTRAIRRCRHARELLGRPSDVASPDMAPKLTGDRAARHRPRR